MLLTRPKPSASPRPGGRGPLSSRGGTMLVAALLSLVAGTLLVLFLREYREDVASSDRTRVVVAASLLPKGTPGNVVLEKRMYRMARVRVDDVREGAFTDPQQLVGLAMTADVFPGHQLTVSDVQEAKGEIGTHLADYDRAITMPVDKAHGMIGKIDAGDRVDVLTTSDTSGGAVAIAVIVARNVLVLAVPSADDSSSSRTQQVTLRVPDRAAASMAAASDAGNVWLVLRPPVGARSHASSATATGTTPNGEPLNADIDISARVRSR